MLVALIKLIVLYTTDIYVNEQFTIIIMGLDRPHMTYIVLVGR